MHDVIQGAPKTESTNLQRIKPHFTPNIIELYHTDTMDPPATRIFTAIEFHRDMDDDVASMVTQPLMEIEEFEQFELREHSKTSLKATGDSDVLPRKALFVGVMTGFFVHAIALGAYALLVVYYGYEKPVSRFELSGDWILYSGLSFLTQIDLLVYFVIWMAFTCTLTQSGMKMIRDRFQKHVQRRYIFVLGVYFLVGIVLGAFGAWGMIDFYLGFLVPILPIAATVLIDLVLCYLMIWCYDVGNTSSDSDNGAVHVCTASEMC